MAGWIYCPVYTDAMVHIARKWNAGRRVKGKPPHAVVGCDNSKLTWLRQQFPGLRHLRDAGAGDKLYILAHGYAGNEADGAVMVGAQRGKFSQGGSLQGYTVKGGKHVLIAPADLARHLESEGLRKSIADLRLFACCRGLAARHKGVDPSPYAQRLKNALVARGYTSVTVMGYCGDRAAIHQQTFLPHTFDARPSKEMGIHKGGTLPGDTYLSRTKGHRTPF